MTKSNFSRVRRLEGWSLFGGGPFLQSVNQRVTCISSDLGLENFRPWSSFFLRNFVSMRKHWNLVSKKSSTKVQEDLDLGIEYDFTSRVMLRTTATKLECMDVCMKEKLTNEGSRPSESSFLQS